MEKISCKIQNIHNIAYVHKADWSNKENKKCLDGTILKIDHVLFIPSIMLNLKI